MTNLRGEQYGRRCTQTTYPQDSSALKRFGNYAPETESKQLEASKTSSFVDKVIPIWDRLKFSHYGIEDFYDVCMRGVRGIHATSEDLSILLVALTQFQEEDDFLDKTGFLISALINCGKEPKYVLDVNMLQYGPINHFGFMNNKEIEITGDVGDDAGALMRRGRLLIYGDAEDRIATELKGGEIHVFGNVEDWAGLGMAGGRLIIYESAGPLIGENMRGGAIHVKCNAYGNIAKEMEGGKIFIGGKIYPRIRVGQEIITVDICEKMTGGEIHMNGNYIPPRGIIGGKVFHKGRQMWPEDGYVHISGKSVKTTSSGRRDP